MEGIKVESKQVLILRKMDKGCRTGKYVAQGCHASVGALFSIGNISDDGDSMIIPLKDPFVKAWVIGRFKKITLQVDNDRDLVALYASAKALGLPVSIITDAGLTEFNGVPTLTAVGIGPADSTIIDKITGHLKLF